MAHKNIKDKSFDVDDNEEDTAGSTNVDHSRSSNDEKTYATVTESINTVTTTPTTSSTTSNIGRNTIPLRAFALPDGRTMDAKNTLQSFATVGGGAYDSTPMAARIVATSSSKNAAVGMTSSGVFIPFNVSSAEKVDAQRPVSNDPHITEATQHTVSSITHGTGHTNSNVSGNVASSSNSDSNTLHAQAVAVSTIVTNRDGNTSDLPFLLSLPPDPKDRPPKSYTSFWIAIIVLIVILVAVVAGVGGYCGSGKCKSTVVEVGNPLSSPLSPTPMMPQITTAMPTPQPTFSNAQFNMACKFFDLPVNTCNDTKEIFYFFSEGGTIPSEIGALTQLTYLDLSFQGFSAKISGTIPASIGNLALLTHL